MQRRANCRLSGAIIVCLLCLTPWLTSCERAVEGDAEATAVETWRFALEEVEGSVQYAYAEKFKELIEERTDGQVQVLIYPYGTLGTSRQMTEQLSMGVLEFAMASPGSIGQFIPELQVFLLHFLLPEEDEQVARLLQHPRITELIDRLYEEKGLKLLSIFNEGDMVWTADRELRQPEDFRGVKFRTMTTPILLKSYNAYGASATPMPYSEVYSGLQLNMIDGQVNPVFAIERQKFYEVCDWMIFPGHAHFVATAAANQPFFESLSAERRELVEEAIRETDSYILQLQINYQRERLQKILEDAKEKRLELSISGDLSGFRESLPDETARALLDENPYLTVTSELTDEEREVFRELSREARQWFLEQTGPRGHELLNRIIELRQELTAT